MKHESTNILRCTNIVRQKIKKEKLFHARHNLLIAFSGGQDSTFCLLLLYLLQSQKSMSSRKEWLYFSKPYQTGKKLLIQPFISPTQFLTPVPKHLIFHQEKGEGDEMRSMCRKKNIPSYQTKNHVIFCSHYLLVWCNHFWQKDSFFTMEHVSQLTLCKNYAMVFCLYVQTKPKYFGMAIKKLLSEVRARHWRHSVMQRLALWLCTTECGDTSIELYLHLVTITKPLLSSSLNIKKGSGDDQLEKRSLLKTTHTLKRLCVQGHNKSDRAETVFFNLIKGTGMNGLATLQWKRHFSSPPNCETTLYPILSDFFKTIRILSLLSQNDVLQPLYFQVVHKKERVSSYKPKTKYEENIERIYKKKSQFVLQNSVHANWRQWLPLMQNEGGKKLGFFSCTNVLNVCENSVNQTCTHPYIWKTGEKVQTFYYQLKYKTKVVV